MKILTQDRTAVIELPREVWVTPQGPEGAIVVSTSYISPRIGNYGSVDRAKAVVKEIFYFYRSGKNSYIMPEE